MNRSEWLAAALGAALFVVGTILVADSHGPMRDLLIADGCRVPVSVLEPLAGDAGRAAVVFHGLAANRRIMQTLGQSVAAADWRVFLVDLPGHGGNLQPYTFARAEECGAYLLETLARRGEIAPDRTVLIGHSMGGTLVVRLADHFPTAATVAISPAPMVRPRRMPSNLLITVSQFDLPLVKKAAARLLRAAGGERDQPEDFRERRAVELVRIPHATHTSAIFDPRVYRQIGHWIAEAVPTSAAQPAGRFSFRGVYGALAGLLGLMLLFPLTASVFGVAFHARGSEPLVQPPAAPITLLRWAIASLLAVGILKFREPLRALGLLSGAYLVSFLLLAGLALVALEWPEARKIWTISPRAILLACALGAATIFVFGAWLNWQLTDAWLDAPRWLRLVFALPFCLPYFFAEEAGLGSPGRRGARRFAQFLLLRLVLWLAIAFAYFVLASGQFLILLFTVYLALFSIVQRLATDAIRSRTGSATGAALFDAILAAWFVAAVFPLR